MNHPFFNYFYGDPYSEQTREGLGLGVMVTNGEPYSEQTPEGLGSGVMVTKYSHISNNHHVIERSSKITVTLSDGTKYTASVIGSNKKTDLAVLKIDTAAKLFDFIELA